MNDKIIYSVTGLFNTPDEITKAAKKVSGDGYKKFDVNTPYPLHGMNSAMKLPASKLGYVALVVGLTGAFTALFLMWWMSAHDYPIVIGGKPFFALPAYIPVTFEVTVLSASLATVLTMLFVFFKLPNNSHPLHDTDYIRAVSSDKYGLSIQAEDENFNENKVKELLTSLGAYKVETIYYDPEELNAGNSVFQLKFLGFLFAASLVTSGATYVTLNKLMFMQPFNWMMIQDKVSPQQSSAIFTDGFGMRAPVQGTVARNYLPYEFKGQPEAAAEKLTNPLLPSKEILELGTKKFNTFCSPCHGDFGEGDSRLRGNFPNPPSLHSDKVRNWTDGAIYHVITDGQNTMPSYSSQMTREEKWAVVLYVRALQRSLNAKETDLQ